MIKFENTEVVGWEAAIRGMRNPMNSWDKSDSGYCETNGPNHCSACEHTNFCNASEADIGTKYIIGPNDLDLMKRLRNAGTDHRKFMRMITVYVDITAPLYWWKEFDTYKVGTVANSCSTMHKIASKEFTLEDFSCEELISDWVGDNNESMYYWRPKGMSIDLFASPLQGLEVIIGLLNANRMRYFKICDQLGNDTTHDEMITLQNLKKKYWWQMIQLLPSSYNQKRTVMLNYEVLANIYKSRKGHKLDEWSEHPCITTKAEEWGQTVYLGFCDWIKTLPYSEMITGESLSDIPICNEIMEEAKKRVKAEEAR